MTEKNESLRTDVMLDSASLAIEQHFSRLGRAEYTLKDYRFACNKLIRFHLLHGTDSYDPYITQMYRLKLETQRDDGNITKNMFNRDMRVSRFFDNHFTGRRIDIVTQEPKASCVRLSIPDEAEASLSEDGEALLTRYYNDLAAEMGEKKAKYRVGKARKLLLFIEAHIPGGISDLDFQMLAEFYCSAVDAGEKYTPLRGYIDLFLGWCEGLKIIEGSLAANALPLKQRRNRDLLPSFTLPEVNAMIKAIDLGTDTGKRDYAFIMLAATTAIRSCDILALELSDIDLEKNEIHFIQHKTGVEMTLPITDVAASAIGEYVSNGRPQTNCQNLFVSSTFPYRRIANAQYILYPIMEKAGIPKVSGDKKGMHAFRRGLGGLLLDSGTDFNLISQILGHSNTATVHRYLPYSETAMRVCLMEMPALTREDLYR